MLLNNNTRAEPVTGSLHPVFHLIIKGAFQGPQGRFSSFMRWITVLDQPYRWLPEGVSPVHSRPGARLSTGASSELCE